MQILIDNNFSLDYLNGPDRLVVSSACTAASAPAAAHFKHLADERHTHAAKAQALIAEVRRFPGQEQQVYDYYRQNAQALAGLRAPVFENKV
eukprot:gene15919-21105_t